jgi:two-component system, NtrC family, sensor kinase
VISRSPGDLKAVFDSILENAVRICGASFGNLDLKENGAFRIAAMYNAPTAFAEARRREPLVRPHHPSAALTQVVATKQCAQIVNLAEHVAYQERSRPYVDLVEKANARTLLVVPLLRDDELIGLFAIYRQEVSAFNEKQIALLQNFAAQAVIAIENARLLSELRESLERQTATADVLKVISSSPGDLDPIFQAMLDSATRLCEAPFGILWLRGEGRLRIVSSHVPSDVPATIFERGSELIFADNKTHPLVRMVETKETSHVADIKADPAYIGGNPRVVAFVDKLGARTALCVPLLKYNECVGSIVVFRRELRAFTDKQIELVQNFAAQAVIAIENTRLLNEQRRSLEQQTATADILRAISQSPTDARPVFDSIVATAVRLLGSDQVVAMLRDGDVFSAVAAATLEGPAARLAKNAPINASANFPSRAILDRQMLHLPDWSLIDLPEFELKVQKKFGIKATLYLPLLREAECIGLLTLAGKRPNMFGPPEIAQAESFRDQALIAIENARLFNELREALQQQTATADVLKVISRSAFDLQTVLDTLVQSAALLCQADTAAVSRQDESGVFHQIASYGYSSDLNDFMARHPIPTGRGSISGRVLEDRKAVQIADVQSDQNYAFQAAAKIGELRTMLGVPLMREDSPIGVLVLNRRTVRPFTAKQIELVETFADQAAIAIENARLLNELRQSLEQQTATAEILRIISTSPSDLDPVFRTMLRNASRYARPISDNCCSIKVTDISLTSPCTTRRQPLLSFVSGIRWSAPAELLRA